MTTAKTGVIKLWLWHRPPLKCFTVSGTFLVLPGLFTRCLYTVSLSLPSLAEPGQLCGRLGLISFGHCLSSCHSIHVAGTGRQQHAGAMMYVKGNTHCYYCIPKRTRWDCAALHCLALRRSAIFLGVHISLCYLRYRKPHPTESRDTHLNMNTVAIKFSPRVTEQLV